MIKKFKKDIGQSYNNIIQLSILFIILEIHEILIYFNAYDSQTQHYNIRRIFWLSFIISITLFILVLITLSSTLTIFKLIGII
jgi:hypothetical protein